MSYISLSIIIISGLCHSYSNYLHSFSTKNTPLTLWFILQCSTSSTSLEIFGARTLFKIPTILSLSRPLYTSTNVPFRPLRLNSAHVLYHIGINQGLHHPHNQYSTHTFWRRGEIMNQPNEQLTLPKTLRYIRLLLSSPPSGHSLDAVSFPPNCGPQTNTDSILGCIMLVSNLNTETLA